MEDFNTNKEALNRELELFMAKLEELLPRYNTLLKKEKLSQFELSELGNIEHYLIELNAKIMAIKEMLQEDLFGHTLDIYFKLKREYVKGDNSAKMKYLRMRTVFQEALNSGLIINWN
jgi:hypothetical protein